MYAYVCVCKRVCDGGQSEDKLWASVLPITGKTGLIAPLQAGSSC